MYDPLVIGFYGRSNCGKTTIISELIKQLAKEGYKICAIKQTDKPLSIDTKNKDTWKYRESGADIIVFSSTIEATFLLPNSFNISIIIKKISQFLDPDIIFIEGANDPAIPKIRIGSITLRENTVFTYKGDIINLIDYIQIELGRKRKTCRA
jgi:molybdopterin-guanine dinucleotide biosynthesis protein B